MNNKKLNLIKKIAIISILSLCLTMAPIATPKTNAFWGEFVQEVFHFALKQSQDLIMGMIRSAQKQASIQTLLSQVNNLASGQGTGNAAFITDWRDYLVIQPKNNAKIYMNSYLSQMTAGRGTSTGYISEGFAGSGNYSANLTQLAKNTIAKMDTPQSMSYEGDPSQMFASGNFKNIGLYASGVNNPWAFNMAADSAYQLKLVEEKETQQAQAIAYQGFKGTTSGDGSSHMITRPGILTKETIANIENLPNNVIASAQSVSEIISSVVSKMINQAIQQGFEGVQKSAQSQNSSQDRLDTGIKNAIDTSGPAARFDIVGH